MGEVLWCEDPLYEDTDASLGIPIISTASLDSAIAGAAQGEESVAERLQKHAQGSSGTNQPDMCRLEPKAFVEQVIKGGLAVDNGDWVQPLFRRKDGRWQLHQLEVLYRVRDAFGVPFPAFVNFVKAASDQSPNPDPELRQAFRKHALASLQRVDARLSNLAPTQRAAMVKLGLLTNLNFTAKQLDAALSISLENAQLLGLEETEYDAPPEDLSNVRYEVWQRLGGLALDDVKPTLADIAAFADAPLDYEPPCVPSTGTPYKPLPSAYNHDVAFARGFIADFKRARQDKPDAKGDLKFDEEFCCYFICVGHAPFSRELMAQWRENHPVAFRALRAVGLSLMKEAMDAGMGVVFEVSFEDTDVQWLHDEFPELDGRLAKQGGRSGSTALPHSLFETELLRPALGRSASSSRAEDEDASA